MTTVHLPTLFADMLCSCNHCIIRADIQLMLWHKLELCNRYIESLTLHPWVTVDCQRELAKIQQDRSRMYVTAVELKDYDDWEFCELNTCHE